jgi:hypothetical protein
MVIPRRPTFCSVGVSFQQQVAVDRRGLHFSADFFVLYISFTTAF